jgi:hypothetical protein
MANSLGNTFLLKPSERDPGATMVSEAYFSQALIFQHLFNALLALAVFGPAGHGSWPATGRVQHNPRRP